MGRPPSLSCDGSDVRRRLGSGFTRLSVVASRTSNTGEGAPYMICGDSYDKTHSQDNMQLVVLIQEGVPLTGSGVVVGREQKGCHAASCDVYWRELAL